MQGLAPLYQYFVRVNVRYEFITHLQELKPFKGKNIKMVVFFSCFVIQNESLNVHLIQLYKSLHCVEVVRQLCYWPLKVKNVFFLFKCLCHIEKKLQIEKSFCWFRPFSSTKLSICSQLSDDPLYESWSFRALEVKKSVFLMFCYKCIQNEKYRKKRKGFACLNVQFITLEV